MPVSQQLVRVGLQGLVRQFGLTRQLQQLGGLIIRVGRLELFRRGEHGRAGLLCVAGLAVGFQGLRESALSQQFFALRQVGLRHAGSGILVAAESLEGFGRLLVLALLQQLFRRAVAAVRQNNLRQQQHQCDHHHGDSDQNARLFLRHSRDLPAR